MCDASVLDVPTGKKGWLHNFFPIFRASLALSILWGGLAQIDPFGLKTAADLQSEVVFMRMVGGPWYKSTARDKITVILVNDAYLDQTGEAWPMSYLQQDLLLTDILGYEPKAVFMDFLYRHRHGSREDMDQLAETIRTSLADENSRRVPVFLPFLARDAEGLNTCEWNSDSAPLQPSAVVLENSVLNAMHPPEENRTYIGWNGCGNRYPMFLAGNPDLPTPAFALYRYYCRQEGHDSGACNALMDENYSGFSDPMVIRWGTGVSRLHEEAMSGGAVECTRSADIDRFTYPLTQLAVAMGQAFSSNRERGQAERCTYTDTLYATWLLGASGELHDFLESMIKDRYIFIGTQVAGVSDYIISPVNGQLPGVYIFAMALDNMVTMGNDYIKELSFAGAIFVEIATLFFTLFIAQTILKFWACRWGLALSVLALKLVLPLFISFLAASILWTVFNAAPMDWVTVAFLGFMANPVKVSDCGDHPLIDKIKWLFSFDSK